MWSEHDALAHHAKLMHELPGAELEAYRYVSRCPRGRMADDLAEDLHISPLTAGKIMHNLAEHGLVEAVGKGTTSSHHTARLYAVRNPRDTPPPLRDVIKLSLVEKQIALEQAAMMIACLIAKHPVWEENLKTGDGLDPNFHEYLSVITNLRRSVQSAQRIRGDIPRL